MILTEKHFIKNTKKNQNLFNKIDEFSFNAKNLKNATNYIIKQCNRISYKLKNGYILDSWEKKLIYNINCGIAVYNKDKTHKLKYIDHNNGFIADAYFLSWYLKNTKEYKAMPLATCAQIVIQETCRDWKSFYKGMQAYKKNKTLGKPNTPGYLDKEKGRYWLVLTSQNFSVNEKVKFPKVFADIELKPRHEQVKQIHIISKNNKIQINVLYESNTKSKDLDKTRALSIDLGVDNLATCVSNTELEPFIINGKYLKSINHYYNKKKAILQTEAMILHNKYSTKRICRLTERRNNKVNDYLHKASRKIVNFALENNIGKIIIGNNQGWKQNVEMGKINNQNFVSIPFVTLIQQIRYKAELVGIEVIVIEESYTSGTSYLDGELPIAENYKKSRRISRGQFRSSKGLINADVNSAYQIMKKVMIVPIKFNEKVTTINVA